METYQIVLVSIAGLIGLSMVWPKITNVVKNVSHKPQPEEEFMQIIAGWNPLKIRKTWFEKIEKFKKIRKKYLIYP